MWPLSRARTCAANGVNAHLAGADGTPARLLKTTGVDCHLLVCDTVEQAVITALSARKS
jgi:hypothetical protein